MNVMVNYVGDLQEAARAVSAFLESKGIQNRFAKFGGPLDIPDRIFPPTDARSEFLSNKAMGDWAEDKLSSSLMEELSPDLKPVHYGDSGNMEAGDPNFRDAYVAAIKETSQFGKRPDLLLVDPNLCREDNISDWSRENADEIAKQAHSAIEVRSSKQQALKYMRVKAEDGQKQGKGGLSFTVKVEDLRVVYRWIEVCQIPQFYFQVFFDSVFAINVLDIFKIVGQGGNVQIDKPAKSQNKATIMIPITNGTKVGSFDNPPEFQVEIRENRLGRIDPFVVPVGGNLVFEKTALKGMLGI